MSNQPHLPPPRTDRVVRVFVSSTFRDMQKERDHLVKFTFPELKRRCRERHVEFFEVDLRWGVTDEQKAEGKVLPICLAEIERCRPFFIGLLGERYGWVPEEIHEELIKDRPWLEEYRGKSVTELEIVHGIFRNPEMKRLAFFYFRSPEMSSQIENELSIEPGYQPQQDVSRLKLESVKEEIRKSGYPVRVGYPDAKTLGQLVLKDLWTIIDKRFPKEEIPTALEHERMEHDSFAEARRKVYIGRDEYYNRLDEHVEGEDPPLILLGKPGSGKSALIANWAKRYREQHPDEFMVLHFLGSTPDSANYIHSLRRIMEEIRERCEPKGEEELRGQMDSVTKEDDIPTDPRKAIEALPVWLAKATAKGKFILVFDALNQLEDCDNAPDLGWLPEYFPPNIRVIFSTLPGRSLEAIKRRGWQTYNIQPLNTFEKEKIIQEYLQQFRKELSSAQTNKIASIEQTSNPLYLKALLDELRVYGYHLLLDQRIDYYLTAKTVEDLYEKILGRYEEDYDYDRPGLVKDAMSLIWVSRHGLSEKELLELLGTNGQAMPTAYWSPLYLAAEESIISRSGLLNFFHDFLRKAVEDRYLHTDEIKRAAHLRLADYFEQMQLDERKTDELPYQLQWAESWERLKDCITDMEIFPRMINQGKQYELVGYWQALKNRFDITKSYCASLDQYEKNSPREDSLAYRLNQTAYFLMQCGRYYDAEPLFNKALNIRMEVLGPDHFYTALSFSNLAWCYKRIGVYDKALLYYYRAFEIADQGWGLQDIRNVSILSDLAGLFEAEADYKGAEPLYQRALAIREKVLGPEHPDTASSLHSLAWLYYLMGKYDEALPLCRRALSIREKALGPEHPAASFSSNNLSLIYTAMGDYDQALPLIQRALEIGEKVYGPEHPEVATNVHNMALVFVDKGDYDEAEPLYQRALAIREQVLGPAHRDTATTLHCLSWLYYLVGKYHAALPLCRRALKIREKALGPEHPSVSSSSNNLSLIYRAMGDYDKSLPMIQRALEISEKVYGPEHPKVATNLQNLALVLEDRGDYDGAALNYKRALAIREKVLGPEHPDTASSLHSLAWLYYLMGKYDEALPLCRRALSIREKALGPEHPAASFSSNNLSLIYTAMGDYDQALPLIQRALEISEKVYGPEHPQVATNLWNMALVLADRGDYDGAALHYKRALAIREKILGPMHPDTINNIFNLAILLRNKGDHVNAHPLYLRILDAHEVLRQQKADISPQIAHSVAASHNNLAFYGFVPAKNWQEAEFHYRQAIELFKKAHKPMESANSGLNLQIMFHLSGQDDRLNLEEIKKLTRTLEEAGDKRAEKGLKLLKECRK